MLRCPLSEGLGFHSPVCPYKVDGIFVGSLQQMTGAAFQFLQTSEPELPTITKLANDPMTWKSFKQIH